MTTTQAHKLTAEEARTFSRTATENAVTVASALECGCEPYVDVFTFNRWIAQGFVVQKGQKAIKLSVVREVVTDDNQTKKVFGRAAVFCRCQVKPL